MKDTIYILQQIGHVLRYRVRLISLRFTQAVRRFIWDEDKVCKEEGCNRLLFTWYRGKYCWKHSRTHRAHTVLVILDSQPK